MGKYSRITELSRFDAEMLSKYQILLLPQKYGSLNEEVLANSDDSISFKKELLLNDLQCADSLELEIETKNIERRGGDIWFGQIYVLDSGIVPILVSLLANYISNKFQLGIKKVKITEEPKVNLELNFFRNGKIDSLKYDGGSEVLLKILDKLRNE